MTNIHTYTYKKKKNENEKSRRPFRHKGWCVRKWSIVVDCAYSCFSYKNLRIFSRFCTAIVSRHCFKLTKSRLNGHRELFANSHLFQVKFAQNRRSRIHSGKKTLSFILIMSGSFLLKKNYKPEKKLIICIHLIFSNKLLYFNDIMGKKKAAKRLEILYV